MDFWNTWRTEEEYQREIGKRGASLFYRSEV